jgi:hypothetical protein
VLEAAHPPSAIRRVDLVGSGIAELAGRATHLQPVLPDLGREKCDMDWIEQMFHVSPDAGDGSLELLFIVCPISALLLGLEWLFWIRRRQKREDPLGPNQDRHTTLYSNLTERGQEQPVWIAASSGKNHHPRICFVRIL